FLRIALGDEVRDLALGRAGAERRADVAVDALSGGTDVTDRLDLRCGLDHPQVGEELVHRHEARLREGRRELRVVGLREVRLFDADDALVEPTPAERICEDLDRILDELLVELDRVEPRLRTDDWALERD